MKTSVPIVYPIGTVRALLQTDQVTEATRQALTERLETPPHQPTFFSTDEFALLTAICDRLIPHDGRSQRIDMASSIDQRLAANKANGWRYDTMPADEEAYKRGLQGVQESAQALFGQYFKTLSEDQQDQVLKAVQSAEAPGQIWQSMPANRFFEELLAEAVESYYSHPLAQEEIGYVGIADAPAWQRIGLNQLEDREPRAIAKPE